MTPYPTKFCYKLLHYGIGGPTYSIIESCLSNRQQFVSINNGASSLKSINIGAPQGFILGPLLFVIYVYNLTNATSSPPRLFADDTCFILNNSTLNDFENNCNSAFCRLRKWCNANELQINSEKSTVIILPPKLNCSVPELNLIYKTSNISVCDSSKCLGVTIDCTLTFKPHILSLETRVSMSIGILSKLRIIFLSSTLLFLYYALVHPHLIYGIPIRGSTFETYFFKLQILQNKAIRIITNADWCATMTSKFRNLKILKIADLYTFDIAKLMHQHSRNSLPLVFPLFSTHSRIFMSVQPDQNQKVTSTFPNFPHVAVKGQ